MGIFDSLMNDNITIVKQGGERITGLKASVNNNNIQLMRGDILVEHGDIIQRNMSNGAVETYKVIDPVFNERLFDIPPNYDIKVKKLGIPDAKKAIQSITYNINGNNARINSNSVDNSINTVNVSADISNDVTALRQEIEKFINDTTEKKDALEVIDEIEQQFKSGSPNATIVKCLTQALPVVGNIASIVSSISSMF